MPDSGLARRWRSRRMVVRDQSMSPAFTPGDRLLVDPKPTFGRGLSVGDVVVLRDPQDGRRLLLKRVAAGPGDPIPAPLSDTDSSQVPADHLYVLSDRREGTRDSRRFGPVPLSLIVGVVWFRYRPSERAGPIPVEGRRNR